MFWGIPLELWPLFMLAIVFSLYAQFKVSSTFKKYARVPAASGRTGAQVARDLLDYYNLHDVPVEITGGHLTDHYDPRNKVLRLSPEVYHGNSLAALGVAAHETGHAVQHANVYLPLHLRNAIFPLANIGSNLALPIFFIGLLFGGNTFLMDLGILLFAGAVFFTILTLPVEFNASSRALAMLDSGGYLRRGEELNGAKKVLSAAAMTYLAATAMALLQLLRLLVLRGGRDE
ncbi:MAG TPA: zinc metallopeptidase [Firmicutes bacterium]|jgi:Zn-dependent membrane protease YugP|nr:zinc metallopeptidase [Bacillota bacterium]HOQ24930.1 zinc metallopeptidase [Bacillota bacterium]HPT68298.1 zinc metallopeptidase [Bacillota bacterium]